MFDALKIKQECIKYLKNYKIPWDGEIKLFKKNIMIHAQVLDCRGPASLPEFPRVSSRKAVNVLIESIVFSYALNQEKTKREELKRKYDHKFGEYDPRKYMFELILEVIKNKDKKFYENRILKYIKLLNKNNHKSSEWIFNNETLKFE